MLIPILLVIGITPAYADHIVCITTPCPTDHEDQPGIGWKIRTWFEDRFEKVFPSLRAQFGESERKEVVNDLKSGLVVAQERINRVQEKLGIDSIREIADVNEINKVYREFLTVESIRDKNLQQQKANELDQKVNRMKIVQQGCEKPINTMSILNSDNYYETLRNNFCNKTLKNVDVNQARGYLGI